ncbi:MAG: 3-hydroxyanthranilate 3,4-dioxygenase [Proteobacteria bacterium]|nr:3-hydroxyanthranilate 3,4-dioxygenase [Pseudomonadota bacterium]
MLAAFNLQRWIDEHRDLLKPPVGNAQIWQNTEFMVTIVGGPNRRTDFHDDPAEEFFYQLAGDITLRVIENGAFRDLPLRQGDVLLLPPHLRHSPQRPANTVGLVIERVRRSGEIDAFEWYCEKCQARVHRREVALRSIVDDLPPVFEEFYSQVALRTCKSCGHLNPGKPAGPA